MNNYQNEFLNIFPNKTRDFPSRLQSSLKLGEVLINLEGGGRLAQGREKVSNPAFIFPI